MGSHQELVISGTKVILFVYNLLIQEVHDQNLNLPVVHLQDLAQQRDHRTNQTTVKPNLVPSCKVSVYNSRDWKWMECEFNLISFSVSTIRVF